jgi:hypothetical protein
LAIDFWFSTGGTYDSRRSRVSVCCVWCCYFSSDRQRTEGSATQQQRFYIKIAVCVRDIMIMMMRYFIFVTCYYY